MDLSWVWLDAGLGIVFPFEFFTRSGFKRDKLRYILTHFFDFFAMVPALALLHFGVPFWIFYVWVIIAARGARVMARVLGDGFVERRILLVVEAVEEEITSRVFLRIIDRVQASLDRGRLTNAVAASLARSKGAILRGVKAARPKDGIAVGLVHMMRLDLALERAEERTCDAIVAVLNSPEMDRAMRDVIASTLTEMKQGVAVKAWRQRLNFDVEQEQ